MLDKDFKDYLKVLKYVWGDLMYFYFAMESGEYEEDLLKLKDEAIKSKFLEDFVMDIDKCYNLYSELQVIFRKDKNRTLDILKYVYGLQTDGLVDRSIDRVINALKTLLDKGYTLMGILTDWDAGIVEYDFEEEALLEIESKFGKFDKESRGKILYIIYSKYMKDFSKYRVM